MPDINVSCRFKKLKLFCSKIGKKIKYLNFLKSSLISSLIQFFSRTNLFITLKCIPLFCFEIYVCVCFFFFYFIVVPQILIPLTCKYYFRILADKVLISAWVVCVCVCSVVVCWCCPSSHLLVFVDVFVCALSPKL